MLTWVLWTYSQTPGLSPFPDLTQPEVAYPLYSQPSIDSRFVSRMEVSTLVFPVPPCNIWAAAQDCAVAAVSSLSAQLERALLVQTTVMLSILPSNMVLFAHTVSLDPC